MDNGARNWMFKFARKHHWRVAAWMDFDDLVQEGYAAYYETLQRYPTATEPKHIMSLFSLVFRSRIERLVLANRKQVDDACSDIIENCDIDHTNTLGSVGTVKNRKSVSKAPKSFRRLVSILKKHKNLKEQLMKPYVIKEDGKRETTNDRLCWLLGKDPNYINVVDELREYFS